MQNGAGAKPVLPSPATIADKTYAPLSRPLFIYVKNSAARRPEVAKFLKFYIEKNNELAVKGGYNPPTAEDQSEQSTDARKVDPFAARKSKLLAFGLPPDLRNPARDLARP